VQPHLDTVKMLPILTFVLEGQHYAFPVNNVVEVAAMVELVSVSDDRPEVIGVANRRGSVLPMLDLRLVMGCTATPIDEWTLFVVTTSENGTIGFVVDEIQQVEYIPVEQLHQSAAAGKYIHGIISYEQRLIQVIDLDLLIVAYSSSAVASDLLKVD
jgi:purine-binding chemotaxis protein CheW